MSRFENQITNRQCRRFVAMFDFELRILKAEAKAWNRNGGYRICRHEGARETIEIYPKHFPFDGKLKWDFVKMRKKTRKTRECWLTEPLPARSGSNDKAKSTGVELNTRLQNETRNASSFLRRFGRNEVSNGRNSNGIVLLCKWVRPAVVRPVPVMQMSDAITINGISIWWSGASGRHPSFPCIVSNSKRNSIRRALNAENLLWIRSATLPQRLINAFAMAAVWFEWAFCVDDEEKCLGV